MNPHWYRDFFQGVTVEMWHKAAPLLHTQDEVELAWRELRLAAGRRVLDVPCGHGRHAVELARRGCLVTGIDISADALALARQDAGQAGVAIDFRQRDMRELAGLEPMDAAVTLGNSFGYLGPEGTADFVRSVAAALAPGGRWLLDSGMAAESILPNLRPELDFELGDMTIRIRNTYLAAESCLETTIEFETPAGKESRQFWHWVFTVGEIRRMLAAAGLEPLELYGTPAGEPYTLGCHYLYVVAQKA